MWYSIFLMSSFVLSIAASYGGNVAVIKVAGEFTDTEHDRDQLLAVGLCQIIKKAGTVTLTGDVDSVTARLIVPKIRNQIGRKPLATDLNIVTARKARHAVYQMS